MQKIKKILQYSILSFLIVSGSLSSSYGAWYDMKTPGEVLSSSDWNDLVRNSLSWVRTNLTQTGSDVYLGLTGNVGIGTTNPAVTLDVSGDAIIRNTNGSINLYRTNDASNGYYVNMADSGGTDTYVIGKAGSSEDLRFGYSAAGDRSAAISSPNMTIATDGNVGIGTSSPTSSAGIGKVLEISSSTTAGIVLQRSSSTQENAIWTDSANLLIDSAGHANASENRIMFRTEETNSSYSPTARMTILSNGNVGIGTTSPGMSLSIAVDGDDGLLMTDKSDGDTMFEMRQAGSGDPYMTIRDSSGNTDILFNPAGNSYFNTTGNVGIGTTSPGGYRLNVNGSINATSIFRGGSDIDGRYINVGETGDSIADGTIDSSEIENGTITSTDIQQSTVQVRVSGTCSAGNSIRVINSNGTVTCEADTDTDTQRAIDDSPVNGATTESISSNWAFDHNASSSAHHSRYTDTEARTAVANISTGYIPRDNGSAFANSVVYQNGSNIGIGTTTVGRKLVVNGDMQANGYFYPSDIRLKEDVQEINGLDVTLKLKGISFKWKESGVSDIGLIAQEVESIIPELVSENKETGMKAVKYGNIVALLVEAIKEQQHQINKHKNEIDELKLLIYK